MQIPFHEQQIIFGGKRLDEKGQDRLIDYNIQKESTVHLMQKVPKASGKNPSPTRERDHEHCIPEYEVLDASSVQIKETNSDFQQSLATNGFTSRCIEAGL